MSQLDGCGKISEYVKTAKLRGNTAIAFTDHGTMRGYVQQHEECGKYDIKPIYGVEFYVSPDMRRKGLTAEEKADITKGLKKTEHRAAIKEYEDRAGIRDRWHLTAWAMNDEGLKNLFRLSSAAFIEGFYYKPRVDLLELKKYQEGVMVSTGCLSSPIIDSCLNGKERFAIDFADELQETFGDRFWLEIQPHAIREQRDANKFVLKLRERYGNANKLLATQDAHYVEQSDWEHHEVLLCIGTGSNLSDPNRFKFDGDEFFMKTRRMMRDTFRRNHDFIPSQLLKEALNSTVDLASRCTAKLSVDYHAARLPEVPLPPERRGDPFGHLRDLCLSGWAWREMPTRIKMMAKRFGVDQDTMSQRYRDRLMHELRELKRLKFVAYFLIIHELYDWVRKQDIMVGPGRGSVGGSLVAYLLGITAVDPLEHGLIFERFINPFRVDLPDCDMDFEDARRHEVMQHMVDTYGRDKTCQIATLGRLSGKQCIKDVSRTLGVPLAEVNEVTKSIIERSSGDERASQTIEDSFKDFEVCKNFDRKYPKVLYHAKRLEGMVKNLGIHAAGLVVSPVPLTDLIPLEIRKHDGKDVIVSAADMYGVAGAGLVKLDVLGLRTLTILKDCLNEVKRRHGRTVDLESSKDVDLNDPKVLKGFTDHDYGGIFQYDTASADKVCKDVEFTSFDDVAAMTALNRPGTSRSGLATKYVERKKNPALVKKVDFHPKVSEITADTLGIIVYQEHVIRIFTECAGFAPGTADSLRKKIAKKVGDETIGKERENFVKGCKEHIGMDEATANKIMSAITFFGSYGFNRSHAVEYGMIAFWTMWCKTYYPLEFYWSNLKNIPERLRIQAMAKDAKDHEIKLLPPHVSSSKVNFAIDDGAEAIRGSLVDIRGVGEGAANAIIAGQPYKDFKDFIGRVDRRKCHKGVVLALARAGALDGMIPSLKWFEENIERILSKKKSEDIDALFKEAEGASDYAEEERVLIASRVNPLAFGAHPIDAYKDFFANHIKVPIVSMSDENFFKDNNGKGVFVAGVIIEVKYNQIGDFHTGPAPSDQDKERQFWGARYANVNIEDAGGTQNRTKFDIDIFDRCRPLIDKGVGTPVIAHVTANSKYENLRTNFAVDLELLRQKLANGDGLDVWESIVVGRHPAWSLTRPERPEREKKHVRNIGFIRKRGGGWFTGLITHVRLKYDRKGNQMAFLGMIGADGRFLDIIAFASVWMEVRTLCKAGRLARAYIEAKPDRERGWSLFLTENIKFFKDYANITL